MASSKLVTTNPDLPRDSSSLSSFSTLLADFHHNTNTNTNMDEILNSIYPSAPKFPSVAAEDGGSSSVSGQVPTKMVEDMWNEIVAGNESQAQTQRTVGARAGEGIEMTLEDFLTKAGAVTEDDVRGVPNPTIVGGPAGGCRVDGEAINGGAAQFAMPAHAMEGSSVEAFGKGIEGTVVGVAEAAATPSGGGGGGGGGRKGKRRVVEERLDKAALQKQRRMIKNRESAARSRERKQAYTIELEYLVGQLEEENARLLKEEADKKKQRFNQLMEYLIPIVEKRKPRGMLGRTNSAEW